jgi:hypothetical protein
VSSFSRQHGVTRTSRQGGLLGLSRGGILERFFCNWSPVSGG